ncbi:Calreticulin-3 [Camellia lanceoleosa]|uniref:Calreticulin-3 n=1 Tax=Camellia lanceoleosa TaxID=1840588 RepID=A0ACC0F6W3_9ERIC|nr:Calreticulin-3 [Camellia lanceoleosa]
MFLTNEKIKNPNYKGKWKTPWIDNPEFEDDPHLYVLKPIKYVGIEVWQIEKDAFEEAEKARRAKEEEDCGAKIVITLTVTEGNWMPFSELPMHS